jgi:DNA polymerase I-like protein with 3'-5' exonuclease and polymerase domains
MEQTKMLAARDGFVSTITGRRRHLGGAAGGKGKGGGKGYGRGGGGWGGGYNSSVAMQAVNSVIQGTASDIIKLAMLAVQRRLDNRRDSAIGGSGSGSDGKSTSGAGAAAANRGARAAGDRNPRLLLQIHDELLLEVPEEEEEVRWAVKTVRECMTTEVVRALVELDRKLNNIHHGSAIAAPGADSAAARGNLMGPVSAACWRDVPIAVNVAVGTTWGDMREEEEG